VSVFPFINPESLVEQQEQALPMFREYAYDFENNTLLLRDGNTYLIEGNPALRIWIYKALSTERFHYVAYDAAFGSEIHTLVGKVINSDILQSEIKRFIVETLMVNPYITELSNFVFEKSGGGLVVEFDCDTIYGRDTITWTAKGVLA